MAWNPYATYGPKDGTGRSWHEYYADYYRSIQPAEEEFPAGKPIVLSQAVGGDLSGCLPQVTKLYESAMKTAEATSWGQSWAYVPGSQYKSGERGGEYREDKIARLWWFYAVYGGQLLRVTYQRDDTWFEFGTARCVNRQIGWTALSDRELKELIA